MQSHVTALCRTFFRQIIEEAADNTTKHSSEESRDERQSGSHYESADEGSTPRAEDDGGMNDSGTNIDAVAAVKHDVILDLNQSPAVTQAEDDSISDILEPSPRDNVMVPPIA